MDQNIKKNPTGDFVLFCCNKDEEEAQQLVDRITRESKNITGYVHVYNQTVDMTNKHGIAGKGVQKWFLITHNFCKDHQLLALKNDILLNSVSSGSKSFVPIWAQPRQEFEPLPFGLVAFFGLDVSDSRLVVKINKMFSQPEHVKAKMDLITLEP